MNAQSTTPWVMRTARVSRRCAGWQFAASCGRQINKGERFAQSKYRAGLAHAELCAECASLATGGEA